MSLIERLRRRWGLNAPTPFTLKNLGPSRRNQNEAWIRSLCYDVALDSQTSICRVLGRFKMFVDPADYSVSVHLILDGYWEMWLTEAIAAQTRAGMIAVDIGANLGYFSLIMADLVGAAGQVHAFEVNDVIADRARKSAALNGFEKSLTVHNQALGDTDGASFVLVVPPGQPGGAYLVPKAECETVEPLAVKSVRRLDSYPELFDVDIIKIDVEGAEEAVWRGMEGILSRGRPMTIFLEFVPIRYADPRAFLEDIAGWGFQVRYLDPANGILDVSFDQIVDRPPGEDQLLVLSR